MEKLLLPKIIKAGPETLKQHEPNGIISHKLKAGSEKINHSSSDCSD